MKRGNNTDLYIKKYINKRDLRENVCLPGFLRLLTAAFLAIFLFTGCNSAEDSGYGETAKNSFTFENFVTPIDPRVQTSSSSLETSENGTTVSFDVKLTRSPTSVVTISLISSDTTEGTISPQTVILGPDNWQQGQAVTVTGQDDYVQDGDIPYSIRLSVTGSSDPDYVGLETETVSLINRDDDVAGYRLGAVSGNTSETGGQATFTVRLTSEPLSDVSVNFQSSDITEGQVDPDAVTFTAQNWSQDQTITITGQDDDVDDGNFQYSITTNVDSSNDSTYNLLSADNISVTNVDDDTAGINISRTTLETSEDGSADSFIITLSSEPLADVVIDVSSDEPGEGTPSPQSVTLNADNWSTGVSISITGLSDDIADGDQTYSLILLPAVSSDANYSGLDPQNIQVTNRDRDAVGINISKTSLEISEDGSSDVFTVTLASKPMADVIIDLSNGDLSEGNLSTGSVTLTDDNWNTGVSVTVSGLDDDIADSDQVYSITVSNPTSDDPAYAAIDPDDIQVTNRDNDVAGIVVSKTNLETSEDGSSDAFLISLATEPVADVIIDVSSDNPAEGGLSAPSVTLNSGNWNTGVLITVTGLNDFVADGDQSYSIILPLPTGSDPVYTGIDPDDVQVTNRDNDTVGIIISKTELETSEDGSADAFTVTLATEPVADVVIDISSDDPGEGNLSLNSVTLTPDNWNTGVSVTVTGLDDNVDDDEQVYSITLNPAGSDPLYTALVPDDIQVTNLDNDAAGIIVGSISNKTSEDGMDATFDVRLASEPTDTVLIQVYSDNSNEASTVPTAVLTLEFTPSNWSQPQTVTIEGKDDDYADGENDYTVVLDAASSSDAKYDGMDPEDVSASNIDNDAVGFTVTPLDGLVTSEDGGTATFTVVPTSRPFQSVSFDLSSDNPVEGEVSPLSASFEDSDSWNVPIQFTVTGNDDSVIDPSSDYQIILNATTSTDPSYDGLVLPSVGVINQDNDLAQVVADNYNLVTTEGGSGVTFTVTLSSIPAAPVRFDITSDNLNEGTVSPTSVELDGTNWNTGVLITVTPTVDDIVAENPVIYSIVMGQTDSSDDNFNNIDPTDVTVTNNDNDFAGITATPSTGLVTSEDGSTDTFDVTLTTPPTATVVVGVSSDDPGEGIVNLSSLTFDDQNWDQPQTITITGQDDLNDDGNVSYGIVLGDVSSDDTLYASLESVTVAAVNNDDADQAGFAFSSISGDTSEDGSSAWFTVHLLSEPISDVEVTFIVSDSGEGEITTPSGPGHILTFTSSNWTQDQTVDIQGVNDDYDDGDQPYQIEAYVANSLGADYAVFDANNTVLVGGLVNYDDGDTAGINMTPTSTLIEIDEGESFDLQIWLDSRPTGTVTIDLNQVYPHVAHLSETSVQFQDDEGWSAVRTITVTADDDPDTGGPETDYITFDISSSDASYDSMVLPETEGCAFEGLDRCILVRNIDTDTAGLEYYLSNAADYYIDESDGTGDDDYQSVFSIRLKSKPDAYVDIILTEYNPDWKWSFPQGAMRTVPGSYSTEPVTLRFEPDEWDQWQYVYIYGYDDDYADGTQRYRLWVESISGDDEYHYDFPLFRIPQMVRDNDVAGFDISDLDGDGQTSEAGGTTHFTVKLTAKPFTSSTTEPVSVDIFVSDPTEAVLDKTTLTFTILNWDVPQTVTVTGVDDDQADGDQTYSITFGNSTSSIDAFNNLVVEAPESFSNILNVDDNDAAGVEIVQENTTTSEMGDQASFTVRLTSEPVSDDVVVTVNSSDPGEGTAEPATITFKNTNRDWTIPRRVTVTGVDDGIMDGDQSYSIDPGIESSSSSEYLGLDPDDVPMTNIDDESAGFIVSKVNGATTEFGGTASFFVRLVKAPTDTVTIDVSSDDAGEGSVSPAGIEFTSSNWDVYRKIGVTGVDDATADGDQTYTVRLDPANSLDPAYSLLPVKTVNIVNIDNETAGITVGEISGHTSEDGGTATFPVRLNTEPSADVSISLESNNENEGTVSPESLLFTGDNWQGVQTVTVTGVDDASQDGEQLYSVRLNAAVSDDPAYNGIDPDDVVVYNDDNDNPGFEFIPITGVTTERGDTAVFSLRLKTQPTDDVVVDATSDDSSEGVVSPATLSFNSDNWDGFLSFTVTGQDDAIQDGHRNYNVILSAGSSDPDYDALDPDDVAVTNIDDENPGFIIGQVYGTASEHGDTATFGVKLSGEPSDNVTINLSSSDTSEGTVNPTSLVFPGGDPSSDWFVEQTVTVTGVDDASSDGNMEFTIVLAPAVSNDTGYNGLDPDDVELINIDNDDVGVIIGPLAKGYTSEDGSTDTFDIKLAKAPEADETVTLDLVSSDETEGVVSPLFVEFTNANYQIGQTITITGQDDLDPIADGDRQYRIEFDPSYSSDASSDYNGILPSDIILLNKDND